MKRYAVALIGLLTLLSVYAQDQKKFSPEKFDADMEDFVTREAHFDQQEANRFFPIFREMHKKQRAVYARIQKRGMQKPADDASCAEAVKEADKLNVELREIEQKYHEKMLKVVSASKVYDAIKAESRFHRMMMRGWQRPPMGKPNMGKPKDKRR